MRALIARGKRAAFWETSNEKLEAPCIAPQRNACESIEIFDSRRHYWVDRSRSFRARQDYSYETYESSHSCNHLFGTAVAHLSHPMDSIWAAMISMFSRISYQGVYATGVVPLISTPPFSSFPFPSSLSPLRPIPTHSSSILPCHSSPSLSPLLEVGSLKSSYRVWEAL